MHFIGNTKTLKKHQISKLKAKMAIFEDKNSCILATFFVFLKEKDMDSTEVKKPQYSNIIEHIRRRPAMYLGSINSKGLVNMCTFLVDDALEEWLPSAASFSVKNNGEITGVLEIKETLIEDTWGKLKQNDQGLNLFSLAVANALSSRFSITLSNSSDEIQLEQRFEKGIMLTGKTNKEIFTCAKLKFTFLPDSEIWKEAYYINASYLAREMRELAFLQPDVTFKVQYSVNNELAKNIYSFKKGLVEKVEIEILDGLCTSVFKSSIQFTVASFKIDIAFAIRECQWDAAILKSYANNNRTLDNGSHVNGLINGLSEGFKSYLADKDLQNQYQIPKRKIRSLLIAFVHIESKDAVFHGCTRNKLHNPEIVKPISTSVKNELLIKLYEDEERTTGWLSSFLID